SVQYAVPASSRPKIWSITSPRRYRVVKELEPFRSAHTSEVSLPTRCWLVFFHMSYANRVTVAECAPAQSSYYDFSFQSTNPSYLKSTCLSIAPPSVALCLTQINSFFWSYPYVQVSALAPLDFFVSLPSSS